MTRPIWLDEARRPLSTRPCWHCGRETPVFRLRECHLVTRPDWRPFRTERSVRLVRAFDGDGAGPRGGRLVPVWDQRDRPDNPLQRHEPATL